MTTTARQDCLYELRALIDRADQDGFAVAQNLLLRFALSQDGPERRAEAMDDLLTDLAHNDGREGTPAQQAFRVALLAMLERTRSAVGPSGQELQG